MNIPSGQYEKSPNNHKNIGFSQTSLPKDWSIILSSDNLIPPPQSVWLAVSWQFRLFTTFVTQVGWQAILGWYQNCCQKEWHKGWGGGVWFGEYQSFFLITCSRIFVLLKWQLDAPEYFPSFFYPLEDNNLIYFNLF